MYKKVVMILSIFFSSVLLISCSDTTTKDASKYNDSIVAQQEKVISKFDELDSTFSEYDASKMDAAYDITEKQIISSIDNINKLGNFKDKSDLKDATIKLFETYKSILENEYKKMIILSKLPENKFTSIEENKLEQLSTDIDKKLNEAFEEFTKKQREFASKYNFQLEAQ